MRIALVAQEYPPETAHGGIATQTYEKAHGLAALGHDVCVISHSAGDARHEYMQGPVRIIRIPGFDRQLAIETEAVRCVTYSALVAAELSTLQQQQDFDVIDFPEWGSEGYVYLLNRSGRSAPRAVVHLHGPLVMLAHTIGWPEQDSEFYRAGMHMEHTCLRLADAIMSSSRCSRDWCSQHYAIDNDNVPVLHTGVDTARFHPNVASKNAYPTIIFVGRVTSSKGVDVLIDAACGVADHVPNLRVRLTGRSDAVVESRLRRLASERGHPDLLEFVGFVAHDDLPEELCKAHVFAAPSRYEGGPGFVYLEAMACGLPVVGCSGNGAADTIEESEGGALVPAGDVEGLKSTLHRLLTDASLRIRMGQAARAYAVAHADKGTCIRRIAEFYEGVVAGRR